MAFVAHTQSVVVSQVRIDGKLSMYFYDIEAGSHTIMRTRIPPRSSPHMLEAVVDASNVPTGRCLCSECPACSCNPDASHLHDTFVHLCKQPRA